MCIRQLAFIPAWIRGPEFLISRESLNPVTGGHLRAAGRRQETPKKAVVVGGQPLQVYGNERKAKASRACDLVSFPVENN